MRLAEELRTLTERSDVTSTTSDIVPTSSLTFSSMVWPEGTWTPLRTYLLNPARSTWTVYFPTWRPVRM